MYDEMKVVTPDSVTPIEEYGKIINKQADMIADLNERIMIINERLERLEKYNEIAIKKKTFKKYVIIASSEECREVLMNTFESEFDGSIVHINTTMRNVVYYSMSDDILKNGEVIIINREFFDRWKQNKRYKIVTIEELVDILKNEEIYYEKGETEQS